MIIVYYYFFKPDGAYYNYWSWTIPDPRPNDTYWPDYVCDIPVGDLNNKGFQFFDDPGEWLNMVAVDEGNGPAYVDEIPFNIVNLSHTPTPTPTPVPLPAGPRPIVIEEFTGTWCPVCYGAGMALDEIEANYSRRQIIILTMIVTGLTFHLITSVKHIIISRIPDKLVRRNDQFCKRLFH